MEEKKSSLFRKHAVSIIAVVIIAATVIVTGVWNDAQSAARDDAAADLEKARNATGQLIVHVTSHTNKSQVLIVVCADGSLKDQTVVGLMGNFTDTYELKIGDRTVLVNYSFWSVQYPNQGVVLRQAKTVHIDEGLATNVWFDVGW